MYTQVYHCSKLVSPLNMSSFGDYYTDLDRRPSFDLLEPCLEAGEFVKIFNSDERVRSDPAIHP